MPHRDPAAEPVLYKPAAQKTLFAAAIVLAVGLVIYSVKDKWEGMATASSAAGQTFEVGPKDWVQKPIPSDSLWNTTTDKPVWVRVHNCDRDELGKCTLYQLLPDTSVLKWNQKEKKLEPAPACRPGGPSCMDFGTATAFSFLARDKDVLANVTIGRPVRR